MILMKLLDVKQRERWHNARALFGLPEDIRNTGAFQ